MRLRGCDLSCSSKRGGFGLRCSRGRPCKCSEPTYAVGMPRARLRSSDVSEDGVLSGDAPAFTFAGVFGGMVIRRPPHDQVAKAPEEPSMSTTRSVIARWIGGRSLRPSKAGAGQSPITTSTRTAIRPRARWISVCSLRMEPTSPGARMRATSKRARLGSTLVAYGDWTPGTDGVNRMLTTSKRGTGRTYDPDQGRLVLRLRGPRARHHVGRPVPWLSTTQGKRMGSGLTARPDAISAVSIVFEIGKRRQSVLRAAGENDFVVADL